MRSDWLKTGLGLTLLLLVAVCRADYPPVSAIVFEGNEVTKERVLRRELLVHEGGPADPQAIADSRQAIMDLGLFRAVRIDQIPADDGVTLVVTVDEKHYILPLPRLEADPDGDYAYGAELRLDNLAGLNQRLRFLVEYEGATGDDSDARQLSMDYRYPRVGGSRNNLDVHAGLRQEELEQTDDLTGLPGLYRVDAEACRIGSSRWLNPYGISQGWLVGADLGLERREYRHLAGAPGLNEDGQVVEVGGRILFSSVHDFGTYRDGQEYGAGLSVGAPVLGSDEDHLRTELFWRTYSPLGGGGNLNQQLRIGLANGSRFGEPAFQLGGGQSLRGYPSGYADGNASLLFNLEYHRPLFGTRSFKGVLFVDVGNVYDEVGDVDPTDLKTGLGFGFRWDLVWFVDVTLRADFAYGVDAEDYHSYGGTDRSF